MTPQGYTILTTDMAMRGDNPRPPIVVTEIPNVPVRMVGTGVAIGAGQTWYRWSLHHDGASVLLKTPRLIHATTDAHQCCNRGVYPASSTAPQPLGERVGRSPVAREARGDRTEARRITLDQDSPALRLEGTPQCRSSRL